jgi:hypothetical protein
MDAAPVNVSFNGELMRVDLSNGIMIEAPVASFPRLLNATPQQRAAVEISRTGLHWDTIDEDLSVAGLIRRFGARRVERD